MALFLAASSCAPAVLRPVDQELLAAATVGNTARAEAALAHGAAANAKGAGGWTPLMLAARSDDASTVTMLLRAGADVNARNELGQTALMVCAANVVKPLVDAGADVNARATKDDVLALVNGETALMMPSDVEKTRALLAAGAQVNARGVMNTTALSYAALRGEGDRVTLLLEAGADVDAKRDNGRTALMDAAYQGNAETVRLLLNAGADVGASSLDGRTPLHFAAMNLRRGVVQTLLAAHPEINARASDGSTPLLLAARDGVLENARSLLAAGADPDIPNAAGQTALQWATAKSNQEMITLLRNRGGNAPAATVGIDELRRTARTQRDGALELFATDVMTDGRVAKIRGRVRNTCGHRVEGIRFEVVVLESGSLRALDTLRQEVATTLDPGQEGPLRLDVQSIYLGNEPRLLVRAFPIKLSGAE